MVLEARGILQSGQLRLEGDSVWTWIGDPQWEQCRACMDTSPKQRGQATVASWEWQ